VMRKQAKEGKGHFVGQKRKLKEIESCGNVRKAN